MQDQRTTGGGNAVKQVMTKITGLILSAWMVTGCVSGKRKTPDSFEVAIAKREDYSPSDVGQRLDGVLKGLQEIERQHVRLEPGVFLNVTNTASSIVLEAIPLRKDIDS